MSLVVIQQEALFTEPESRNGATKTVHYIVKNTPFTVRLGMVSLAREGEEGVGGLNFNNGSLHCTLLYDFDDPKEVDGVKGAPLDYVMQADAHSNGMSCIIQFKVRVLTTQHQGCHFVIRIRLSAKGRGATEVLTDPIKSCSKMEQIRRKEAEKQGKKATPKKKRARGEELLETLEEIKATQREQANLLNSLLNSQLRQMHMMPFYPQTLGMPPFPFSAHQTSPPSSMTPASTVNPAPTSNTPSSPPTSRVNSINSSPLPPSPPCNLEDALRNVIVAYSNTNVLERPSKIRCLYETLSQHHKPVIREVGSLLCNTTLTSSGEVPTVSPPTFTTISSPDSSLDQSPTDPQSAVEEKEIGSTGQEPTEALTQNVFDDESPKQDGLSGTESDDNGWVDEEIEVLWKYAIGRPYILSF